MKILITGAAGFVGSHVTTEALSAGHEVTAIRRKESQTLRTNVISGPNWLTSDFGALGEKEFVGHDVVIHLAAAGISPRQSTYSELVEVNVANTLELFIRADSAGVKKWVVAGSFAEYGEAGTRYDRIPPDAPLEPTTPYAASKAAAYALLRSLALRCSADLDYLRLFNVYGEGQFEGNLWPSLKAAAESGKDFELTPGQQIRDFVSVEDVAKSILRFATDERSEQGRIRVANVASGRAQSIAEFTRCWWDRWDAKGQLQIGALPYRPNEVMRFIPDIERIAEYCK